MEKKKNFKCFNKLCGVSYTAESLGPCPVCGKDDTSLDKNRKLYYLLLFSGIIVLFVGIWWEINDQPIDGNGKNGPEVVILIDSTDTMPDTIINPSITLDKCKEDVRLDKPRLNENSKELTVRFASESEDCSFLYKVNTKTIQPKKVFTFSEGFYSIKVFKISVFDENEIVLTTKIFDNDLYDPPLDENAADNLKSSFINNFIKLLSEYADENKTSDDIKAIKSNAKDLGISIDETKFKVIKNGNHEMQTLNALLTDIEDAAASEEFYEANESDITFKTNSDEGAIKVELDKVVLSKK